jgi:hypothetical protein
MPYLQRTTPQAKKSNNFTLKNFNGGLNNFSNIIGDNEASDLLNVTFTDESLVEKRNGLEQYTTFVPNTFGTSITFVDEYSPYVGDPQLFIATDTRLFYDSTDNTKYQDVAGRVSGSTYLGKYFFCDGDSIYAYGSFNVTASNHTVIIGTQTSANTIFKVVEQPVVSGTFTKTSGAYKLVLSNTTANNTLVSRLVVGSSVQLTKGGNKIKATLGTFNIVSGNIEIPLTSVSDVVGTLISGNAGNFTVSGYILKHTAIEFESEKSTVVGDANSDPAVTGVTYYNFTNKTVWYEPCVQELSDTTRGANVFPTKVKFVKSHHGRLFFAGSTDRTTDDIIYMSEVANPYYFPYYAQLQVTQNGDSITAIEVFNDSLVVARKNDMHVVYGYTNDSKAGVPVFQVKKINVHTGVANNNSIVRMHNYLAYVGTDGSIYVINTVKTDAELLASQIISKKLNMFDAPISIVKDDIDDASICFHDDKLYVSIGDKVLVYFYRFMAWSVWKFTNIDPVFMYTKMDGTEVLYASTKIYRHSQDYLDAGMPYFAKWKSKQFDMGTGVDYKQFREFFLVFGMYNSYDSQIKVRFEVDYSVVLGDLVFSTQDKLTRFGTAIFGDRFINKSVTSSDPVTIGQRGKTLSILVNSGFETYSTVANMTALASFTGAKEGTVVYVTTPTYPDASYSNFFVFKNNAFVQYKKSELNQPFKLYEINGQYQFRGKR